jgi:hypothetical protein
MLTIEESILRNKILEDSELFMRNQTIEVLYPDPKAPWLIPPKSIITLEEARAIPTTKANQLFCRLKTRFGLR